MRTTSFNGGSNATLTNEGAVELAEGLELYVASGDSFSNGAGGSISATGSANVFVPSGATFNEGAGTTQRLAAGDRRTGDAQLHGLGCEHDPGAQLYEPLEREHLRRGSRC